MISILAVYLFLFSHACKRLSFHQRSITIIESMVPAAIILPCNLPPPFAILLRKLGLSTARNRFFCSPGLPGNRPCQRTGHSLQAFEYQASQGTVSVSLQEKDQRTPVKPVLHSPTATDVCHDLLSPTSASARCRNRPSLSREERSTLQLCPGHREHGRGSINGPSGVDVQKTCLVNN